MQCRETAAEENATSYYPLVDRIAEGRFLDFSTDEELYTEFSKVLRDDGHITKDDAMSSFRYALSIHSAAPRIEAQYQFYETSVEPSMMVTQEAACPVWVHFDRHQYCSPTLDRAQQDIGPIKNPDGLPFDRVLGHSTRHSESQSILYADITSPVFAQFHQTVSATAKEGSTSYRIRYRPPFQHGRKPLAVNGYGVELALKRTDYIVIDDRQGDGEEGGADSKQEQSDSHTNTSGDNILTAMDEDISDLKPLTAKELSGLGLKATSFIMDSEDPFDTLLKISQDFPKFSHALSRRNASAEVVSEHKSNREAFLPSGYNVIWMNGQQVQSREMDAFALLQQMRRERAMVGNLRELGFTGSEAVSILSHSAIAESKSKTGSQRYNYRDDLEGGKVIIWLNDIEKDKRYNTWPGDLESLLQRTWPGQLPQVRRDIHNVVIPMDLTDVTDIEILVEQLQMIVKRKVPIRFGFVPLLATPNMVDQAKIVYHLSETFGLSALFTYLEQFLKDKPPVVAKKEYFTSATKDRQPRSGQRVVEFEDIFTSSEKYPVDKLEAEGMESAQESDSVARAGKYLARLEAHTIPAPFFSNGVAMSRNENWLNTMSGQIDFDLRSLQRQVYDGIIPEETSLASYLIESAPSQRNALIVPEDEATISIINIGDLLSKYGPLLETIPQISSTASEIGLERFGPHFMLVADLDSDEGQTSLLQALDFQSTHKDSELVILHNPGRTQSKNRSTLLATHVSKSGHILSSNYASRLFRHTHETDSTKQESTKGVQYWSKFSKVVEALNLGPGQSGIFLNGRKVGPLPSSNPLSISDLELLLRYERSKRLEPAEKALTLLGLHDRVDSPLKAAILTSTIALSGVSDIPEGIFDSAPTIRMDRFHQWAGSHTLIQIGDPEASSIHIVASIDPTSQTAQRWLAILKVLSNLDGVFLKLYLNPQETLSDLPIKRFYRYVLNAEPTFSPDGEVQALAAEFRGVPKEALLNLALDVPPAWLVAAKESIHDLDNIKLTSLQDGLNVDALYELEHILIEGHSRDTTVGQPPRGVQVLLGTDKDPHFADTIIMANLGYFQFKSNPGYWNLKLQTGRSSQIFTIDSAGPEGYYAAPGDERTDITLMSFQGKTLYPRLSRKAGQEEEDVLEAAKNTYIERASKLASSFLSKTGLAPAQSQHADINIFSVASGHLYERMLSIMMVSTMRHTTHRQILVHCSIPLAQLQGFFTNARSTLRLLVRTGNVQMASLVAKPVREAT
jgi:UDP-glucose:glycoprotein glucosyltransferase